MGWSSKWDSFTNSQEFIDKCNSDYEKEFGKLVTLEIPIKGAWGSNSIQAIQVGDLAVHKPLGWDDKYNWRVTHVPTLTMFDKAVPFNAWVEYTDEQLIQWCWKVQQDNDNLWADLRAYNNSNYETIHELLLNSVKEYCLSIKV